MRITQGASHINRDGIVPLERAVRDGDLPRLLELLQAGADPNSFPTDQYGPLQCAVVAENCEAVEALLAHGADVSRWTHGNHGASALESLIETYLYHPKDKARRVLKALLVHGAQLEPDSTGTYSLRDGINRAKEEGFVTVRERLEALYAETVQARADQRAEGLSSATGHGSRQSRPKL